MINDVSNCVCYSDCLLILMYWCFRMIHSFHTHWFWWLFILMYKEYHIGYKPEIYVNIMCIYRCICACTYITELTEYLILLIFST